MTKNDLISLFRIFYSRQFPSCNCIKKKESLKIIVIAKRSDTAGGKKYRLLPRITHDPLRPSSKQLLEDCPDELFRGYPEASQWTRNWNTSGIAKTLQIQSLATLFSTRIYQLACDIIEMIIDEEATLIFGSLFHKRIIAKKIFQPIPLTYKWYSMASIEISYTIIDRHPLPHLARRSLYQQQ